MPTDGFHISANATDACGGRPAGRTNKQLYDLIWLEMLLLGNKWLVSIEPGAGTGE
jgi:hypothetical protein